MAIETERIIEGAIQATGILGALSYFIKKWMGNVDASLKDYGGKIEAVVKEQAAQTVTLGRLDERMGAVEDEVFPRRRSRSRR